MSAREVPIRFWSRIQNLGDAVTPYILRDQLGVEAVQASKNEPHVLAIGSILALANRHSVIWGAGIMDPGAPLGDLARGAVRAVRGKRTLEALRRAGVAVGDVPLGDPGVFVAGLLGPQAPGPAAFDVAVIPHHSSFDSEVFSALRGSAGVALVNFRRADLDPIGQIARADVVISESLHGLIFAEALGKPSVWISFKRKPYWDFKYEDWFSTTANPQRRPVTMDEVAALGWSAVAKLAERRHETIDRSALLSQFPHELVRPARRGLVGFDECRRRSPVVVDVDFQAPDLRPGEPLASPQAFHQSLAGGRDLIRAALAQATRGWAETAYSVVRLGGVAPVGGGRYGAAVEAMNRETGVQCLFLLPPNQDRAAAYSPAPCVSATFMLRPGADVASVRSFATLFVDDRDGEDGASFPMRSAAVAAGPPSLFEAAGRRSDLAGDDIGTARADCALDAAGALGLKDLPEQLGSAAARFERWLEGAEPPEAPPPAGTTDLRPADPRGRYRRVDITIAAAGSFSREVRACGGRSIPWPDADDAPGARELRRRPPRLLNRASLSSAALANWAEAYPDRLFNPRQVQPELVFELPGGLVIDPFFAVLTPANRLLRATFRASKFLREFARKPSHYECDAEIAANVERLEGPVATLGPVECANFYHWMTEGLARAHMLRRTFGRGFRVLVPPGAPGYVASSLALLGYGPEDLIHAARRTAYRPDVVLFATTPVESIVDLQPWLFPFFETLGARHDGAAGGGPGENILISRAGSNARRLLNEDALLAGLSRPFVRVQLEGLPLETQMAVMRRARRIVAPHGAGLTHLLSAHRDVKVVELVLDTIRAPSSFWAICDQRGLEYAAVMGAAEGEDSPNADFTVSPADIPLVDRFFATD